MSTQPEALRLAEVIEGSPTDEGIAKAAAELRRLHEVERRYQWLANRTLCADYGDNETGGKENGWRIVFNLLAHDGRQPAFMYGRSIDKAIDAELAKAQGDNNAAD